MYGNLMNEIVLSIAELAVEMLTLQCRLFDQ